jgi:hypothetical protein
MISLDYSRWVGFAICAGGAAYSARMLFDTNYAFKIIHKTYKKSDQASEKMRLLNARIAAGVVFVGFAYFACKFLVYG